MSTRAGIALWLFIAVALAAAAVARTPAGGGWVTTDIRALLPDTAADPLVAAALRRLTGPFDQATLWLVGRDRASAAAAGSRELAAEFERSGLFSQVDTRPADLDREHIHATFSPYRHGLMAPADARRLASDPDRFLQRRLAMQYGLAGAAGGSLRDDPLGLHGAFLEPLIRGPAATIVDGTVVIEATTPDGERRHFGLVTATAATTGFSARGEPELLRLWRDLLARHDGSEGEVLVTGAPLYGAYAAASAQREIMLIGGVSLLAIVGLLLWRFRSPRPLAVTLLVIAAGVGGGLGGVLLAFGSVHLIALVFGATVIGVAVDYAFHYLCDSLRPGWTPRAGLRHVLPALSLALASSGLAFLSLALAPFPALQQVAVFTTAGLVASWLTVVLLLPALVRPATGVAPPGAWQPRRRLAMPVLFILVGLIALPGILLLDPQDDIGLLYAAPDRLARDDARIGELLARPEGNRFLLIEAASEQAVLERQEKLFEPLTGLVDDGRLDEWWATARLVPSHASQQNSHRLLRDLVDTGRLAAYLDTLGFPPAAIDRHERAILEARGQLEPKEALAALDARHRMLWLGCADSTCSAVIAVSGIRAGDTLAGLANEHDGVRWIDNVAEVGTAMRDHRWASLALLALALAVAGAVLTTVLGPRRASRVVTVPVLAILVSLAVVGYTGTLFTVFNLMALLLVLGVGIDYALFYHCAEPGGRRGAALAISMAAATTVLAFGLLGFSQTPVISAFGFTLVPGLFSAWLLALLTGSAGDGRPSGATVDVQSASGRSTE